MTSKKLFFKTMLYDLKKRGWCLAIIFLICFFALPVRLLLSLQGNNQYGFLKSFTIRLLYEYDTFGFGEGTLVLFLLAACAILLAVSGFSYLNSKKKVDFTHSMPIRREILFLSKYTAGVLLYMMPLILNVGISLIIAVIYRHLTVIILQSALCYILYQFIYFLLFYGTAILAIVLVGNFVVSFLGIIILYFYQTVMWGVTVLFKMMFFPSYMFQYDQFQASDPFGLYLRQAGSFCKYSWESDYTGEPIMSTVKDYYSKGWSILLLALAAAVIVAAASFFLFRLRSSESAGKTIAFAKAEPIVKVLLLLPSGLIGGLILRTIAPTFKTAWYIFGVFIFFLLAAVVIEMIFRQDFKGFFKHKISASVGFFCVLAVSLVFHLDLIGFESRIPKAQEVESVGISIPRVEENFYVAYNIDYVDVYSDGDSGIMGETLGYMLFPSLFHEYDFTSEKHTVMEQCSITGEEEIEKVRRLSEFYVNHKDEYQAYLKKMSDWAYSEMDVEEDREIYWRNEPQQLWFDVYCVYRLKNGKEIYRGYRIPYNEEFSEVVEPVYDNESYKMAANPILSSEDNYTYANVQRIFSLKRLRIGVSNQKALLEAYKKDIMAQSFEDKWRKNAVGSFELMNSMGGNRTDSYYIYSDFENTKAFFEGLDCSLENLNTEEEIEVKYLLVDHVSAYDYWGGAEFTEKEDQQEILKQLIRDDFTSLEKNFVRSGTADNYYRVTLQYSVKTDDPYVFTEESNYPDSYSEGYFLLKTAPKCVLDAFD